MPSAGMAAGVNSRQFQFPEVKAVEQYGLMDWTAADLLHGLTVTDWMERMPALAAIRRRSGMQVRW